VNTSTEDHFTAWLRLVTERARDWYESCQRASAIRVSLGGPTLEQMWQDYQLLEAFGGTDFDPNPSRPAADADTLTDAINQEIIARGTFAECLSQELDRTLFNCTYDTRRALRSRVALSMN
jgi:hypothetical protein